MRRMPCFSEMRREVMLSRALATRNTGKPSDSNQKSLAQAQASLISPFPCHVRPSQNPRFSCGPRRRLSTPMVRCRRSLQAQRPDPFIAAGDGGKGEVANELESAVGGIGPGNDVAQITHDLPVWKQLLNLGRVADGEGAQDEAGGLAVGKLAVGDWAGGRHAAMLAVFRRQVAALSIRQFNRVALSHPFPQNARKRMGHGCSSVLALRRGIGASVRDNEEWRSRSEIWICCHPRPAQCGQKHPAERPDGREGGHCHGQAADHAQPHHRRAGSAGAQRGCTRRRRSFLWIRRACTSPPRSSTGACCRRCTRRWSRATWCWC